MSPLVLMSSLVSMSPPGFTLGCFDQSRRTAAVFLFLFLFQDEFAAVHCFHHAHAADHCNANGNDEPDCNHHKRIDVRVAEIF